MLTSDFLKIFGS